MNVLDTPAGKMLVKFASIHINAMSVTQDIFYMKENV